jgi:methionine aminopeptidase
MPDCRKKAETGFPQRWQEVRCGGDDIANIDHGVRVDGGLADCNSNGVEL